MKALSFSPLVLLFACNNTQTTSPGAPVQAVATVSSATTAPTSTAAVRRGHPCASEIARVCPAGMIDGCNGDLTSWHSCVEPATNPTPCSREIALKCSEGKTDVCLVESTAKFHVCMMNEK